MSSGYFALPAQFEQLLSAIRGEGYGLFGPTVRGGALVLDEITSAGELPVGWRDVQGPGRYRLERGALPSYFGYNVGQESWKKYLFLPDERVWAAERGETLEIIPEAGEAKKRAFVGVRACELHAIDILDRVLNIEGSAYRRRRENIFIVAVNCSQNAATCFCTSMGTGPEVKGCFDIALTEVIDRESHFFVVEAGSERGEALCRRVGMRPASDEERARAGERVRAAAASMERSIDANIETILKRSFEAKRWDEVAKRCVNCANCTSVCPTCFCSDTRECVGLDGKTSERQQCWESCFNLSHSYVHGGSVRTSARARYRQWLTHKFSTWYDQFGRSGCVGCGRCITWCPVGIDVTEELAAIQSEEL